MINKNLKLSDPNLDDYILRTIDEGDIELLRTWKNEHRENFFFKEIITPAMQKDWFKSYLQREHDFMMMVVHEGERTGCIGFRRLEDRVDLYNIILGRKQNVRKGHMSAALDLICREAESRYPDLPVMVSVLRKNPAVNWYLKRGFTVTREHEDYIELTR